MQLHLSAISLTNIPSLLLNVVQTLVAIIMVGLIGANYGSIGGPHDHSAAVYTIIISILTLVTSVLLFYYVLDPPRFRAVVVALVVWQMILVVLWAASAGSLGVDSRDNGRGGLKAAIAFAVVEMICWLIGSIMGVVGFCCVHRKIGKSNPAEL